MDSLVLLRTKICQLAREKEDIVLNTLISTAGITDETRIKITNRAKKLVKNIRDSGDSGLMEVFLAEYGLSTDEGVALMCLAEALLRVPDVETIDELIEDKIAPSSWGRHLGNSSSSLVNATTWGLMLSGKILKEPEGYRVAEVLHTAIKRLGEPVIRLAVKQAMKEMGHQFVLGRTIKEAVRRGLPMNKKGYTYSYDMLGEAALTSKDADKFFQSYYDAIESLATHSTKNSIKMNPGISIKLSALHPRYEVSQKARVMAELVPRVLELAVLAKNANMGFNIDAEEADRLDLSLDVIEAVLRSDNLAGWEGFGVVVQAYGKRASPVIDWLYEISQQLNRKIMVRLVKGAYWDTEIKIAQVNGISDFPVFTQKSTTDISYICCAQKLLNLSDRLYPQFATHNAHTVAAILEMAKTGQSFEFQRLHGMGEALHQSVLKEEHTKCRIYAPVGAHRDLLAYLVRRLLENGANSSFVNQIVDISVAPEVVAADPFKAMEISRESSNKLLKNPIDLFQPERKNSQGWDLRNRGDLDKYEKVRLPFLNHVWTVKPVIAGSMHLNEEGIKTYNPASPDDLIGVVYKATNQEVETALASATDWSDHKQKNRAKILKKAADLYEENSGEIFAALCREAGKTPLDAIAEIRESVDFLRYYGAQAKSINGHARGLITCISPWNFPLAIFTGQIAAALAAGNGVVAKPADPTAIIASIGIRLLHEAGVPKSVLQLLPGSGSTVGAMLTSDPRINGVCFTGSIEVAQTINKTMSATLEPDAILIAETGGINAMVVDSTALPEQAIKDIVMSAFQSAGQRCSALRLLYLQEDIAEEFLTMLYGTIDQLVLGKPWSFSTDIGPVISHTAKAEIDRYIQIARNEGRLLKQSNTPKNGIFVAPTVVKVKGIKDLKKEIFGPVLHIATFKSYAIKKIINDINQSGYGLTFGLHTRIDDRVEQFTSALNIGNMYINRNQIGAIVGSQPFGGEGLSGTGPKAGGPTYVPRFLRQPLPHHDVVYGKNIELKEAQEALNAIKYPKRQALETRELPGPTGESNRLTSFPRGKILCLGPTKEDILKQIKAAKSQGCTVLAIAPGLDLKDSISGFLNRKILTDLSGFDAVALWSNSKDLKISRQALAKRKGVIIPLFSDRNMKEYCIIERHICIDITAAGGNAALLAAQ